MTTDKARQVSGGGSGRIGGGQLVGKGAMLAVVEAAFFDLDKTVIARASMVAFGKPLYRAGLISRWLLLRALYGQLVYLYLGADEARMERMRESVLRLTKGWDQAHIRSVVREAIDEVIEPIVYDEALELIRHHQQAGRRVFIVSASPAEIVEPLATYLGVDEFVATRARLDEDGRYSGELELYAYGPFKAQAMREIAAAQGIDLQASYAYSDSATDIPMLECVGHAVAVNPDRELERAARANGWEVRTFVRKVRLRERVQMPPAGPTAAVGGGLAAVVGGLVVWWLFRREPQPPQPPAPPVSRAYAARTFLAATAASATRMTRRRSFFMGGEPTGGERPRGPGAGRGGQPRRHHDRSASGAHPALCRP